MGGVLQRTDRCCPAPSPCTRSLHGQPRLMIPAASPIAPAPQGRTRLAKAKYGKALKLVERALDLDTDEEVAAASALKAS